MRARVHGVGLDKADIRMIDWHSHILPGIDDGSQSVEESVKMLKMLAEQGVKEVIATPHFLANNETVEDFIARRTEAYEKLKENLFEGAPKIKLGAEVAYYSGISRLPELKELCIEGSKCLLLEMPMTKWTEYIIKEIEELAHRGKINLVLAHVDRYMHLQSAKTWERLCESGCIMQVNASSLLSFITRPKIIKMMKEQSVHCIGSDCHNTTTRAPKIGRAYDVVEKKLGTRFVHKISDFGHYLVD